MKVYIGIDNGVTGTIGIIDAQGIAHQIDMPVKKFLNYQKTSVKHINRIDHAVLKSIINNFISGILQDNIICVVEIPMVNPQRFEATTSALRALEAVLIVLEQLNISLYSYIDSKSWQKKFLPYIKVQDKKEFPSKLKLVSKETGKRMYPNIKWDNFKDADGILLATYAKYLDIGTA